MAVGPSPSSEIKVELPSIQPSTSADRRLPDVFDEPAENVLLVKLSYWISR
jgi:hypothetical protein